MKENDGDSSDSSESSSSSSNSIIWIGNKPNGRGSSELTDSTEPSDLFLNKFLSTVVIDPRETAGTAVATGIADKESEAAEITPNYETFDVSKETNDEKVGTNEVIFENSGSGDASSSASETNEKYESAELFEGSKSTDAFESVDEMPGTSSSFVINIVSSSNGNMSKASIIPRSSSSCEASTGSESITSSDSDLDDSNDSNDTVNNVSSKSTNLTKGSLTSSYADSDDAEELWKTFTDEEYVADGLPDVEVPQKSITEYLKFHNEPMKLYNLPPKVPLKEIVDDMLANNKGAYTRIEIGSNVYMCIPTLLKIYSPWFANQRWDIDNFKFNESDVPPKAFKVIYNWMRKKTPITLNKAVKVMQAAKYLSIDLVVDECWNLFSKQKVREKVAFDLFLEAGDLGKLDEFRHVMLSRVRFYFLPMVGTEAFLKLTLAQLISLFELDTIGVNTEAEVFYAAIRWISYNAPDRLQHVLTIMSYIRFPFMSMPTLFAIHEGTRNEPVNVTDIDSVEYVLLQLRRDPKIKEILNNAMSHMSSSLQGDSEDETDLKVPRIFNQPRHWIYNAKCPYHIPRLHYPYKHNITYSDFMNFVQKIQNDWLGEKPSEDSMRDIEYDSLWQKEVKNDESGFLGDGEDD